MKPDFEAEARTALESVRARYDATMARLDAIRYDPPTWSLRQFLLLLLALGAITLAVYFTGRTHGRAAQGGDFASAQSGLQAKAGAEDAQRAARLEADLAAARHSLEEAEKRRSMAESALAAALADTAKGTKAGSPGAVSAASINKVIREVSK